MSQPVEPQIALGPAFADTPRVAFAKYNSHQHWLSVPGSFLFEDIRIGDTVQLVNARGIDVFSYTPPVINPVVDSLTAGSITTSVVAREAATNATLYLPNGRTVRYVSVLAGSNQITRSAIPGMLSVPDLQNLLTTELHGTIDLPPNTLDFTFTRTIALSLAANYRIVRLHLNCQRMPVENDHLLQVTLAVGTPTGVRYLLPTINQTTVEPTSHDFLADVVHNVVQAGDRLFFHITHNSKLVRFDYSLVLYKLL